VLRRAKQIKLPDDDELPEAAAAAEDPILPQRPTVSDESPLLLDRRQGTDRRGNQDSLRTEFQRSLELAEQHGMLNTPSRIGGLSGGAKLRIALVVLALIAGGAAAWLATHSGEPAPVATVAVEAPPAAAPVLHVLVASRAIGLGERLTAGALSWQEWPDKAVRPDYITDTASPDAMTKMAGDVARAEFVAGEPILATKLVDSPDGYLSAVLASGMRGVSVNVTPDAASGGFIVPNDHVDVVLTRADADTGAQVSQTILTNVRVLAINTRLGDTGSTGAAPAGNSADPGSQVFAGQAVATLELNPTQSQMIVNAIAAGKLTLVLRPLTDAKPSKDATEEAADEAIRMTSTFWTAHPTTAITAPNLSTGPYTATTVNTTPR